MHTADFQSESGKKNCFRIARHMAREGRHVISAVCGGCGTRWRTDQIKTLSKKVIFLMIGERVSWCQCTRRNVIYLCAVHTDILVYWSR